MDWWRLLLYFTNVFFPVKVAAVVFLSKWSVAIQTWQTVKMEFPISLVTLWSFGVIEPLLYFFGRIFKNCASASGFDATNKTRTWRHKNSPTWNAEIKNCSYQARNNYSGNADRICKTHFEVIFHSSSVPQPLWPFWVFNNKPLPSAADLELLSGLWVLSLSLPWCCFPRWLKELEVGRFLWVA